MAKQNSSSGKNGSTLTRVVLAKNVQVKPASNTPRASVSAPPSASVRSSTPSKK